jgi:hypothetical protein
VNIRPDIIWLGTCTRGGYSPMRGCLKGGKEWKTEGRKRRREERMGSRKEGRKLSGKEGR